jgi:hypothetical protein
MNMPVDYRGILTITRTSYTSDSACFQFVRGYGNGRHDLYSVGLVCHVYEGLYNN